MMLQWQLRKIRLKEQKKLNDINLYLYKSITVYIKNSDLTQLEKEEILQQIMDMILQAQFENKSVNLIVGEDYEKFCDEVIKEYKSDKSGTYNVLNYIQRYLLWTILISLIMVLVAGITSSFNKFGITIDQFIVANFISLIILPLSKRNRQKTSSINFLIQRMYTMNGEVAKSGIVMVVVLGLLRFVFGRIFGEEIFDYVITLNKAIPYGILIFIIIGSIEVYKKIYDKR